MLLTDKTGRAGNSADLIENTFSQVDAYNKNTKQKTAVPQAQNAARLKFLAARLHAIGGAL
jgi:hypothetical protein